MNRDVVEFGTRKKEGDVKKRRRERIASERDEKKPMHSRTVEPNQEMGRGRLQKKLKRRHGTRGGMERGDEVKHRMGQRAFTHPPGILASFHRC